MATAAKSILEQQLGRGAKTQGAWPWRFLLFSILILAMAIFIYAGMNFGYKAYLNSQLKGIQTKIDESSKRINSEDSRKAAVLYSQIINIKTMLDEHPLPSKLLDILESNTDDRVFYTGMNFRLGESNLKLEGLARDYQALTRQLEYLRKVSGIKYVSLENSQISGMSSDIQFTLLLSLSPEIFRPNTLR